MTHSTMRIALEITCNLLLLANRLTLFIFLLAAFSDLHYSNLCHTAELCSVSWNKTSPDVIYTHADPNPQKGHQNIDNRKS